MCCDTKCLRDKIRKRQTRLSVYLCHIITRETDRRMMNCTLIGGPWRDWWILAEDLTNAVFRGRFCPRTSICDSWTRISSPPPLYRTILNSCIREISFVSFFLPDEVPRSSTFMAGHLGSFSSFIKWMATSSFEKWEKISFGCHESGWIFAFSHDQRCLSRMLSSLHGVCCSNYVTTEE